MQPVAASYSASRTNVHGADKSDDERSLCAINVLQTQTWLYTATFVAAPSISTVQVFLTTLSKYLFQLSATVAGFAPIAAVNRKVSLTK